MSNLEDLLLYQIKVSGLPKPVREARFHPTRRWRFDLCYPDFMVAVEIEGGIWTGGRHTTGKGFEADCIKYSEAALLGWMVIRVTGGMIKSGLALHMIGRALGVIESTPELPSESLHSVKVH